MARQQTKRTAKKYNAQPTEYPNHKYWEMEKIATRLKNQGKNPQEIYAVLESYVKEELEKCAKDPIYFADTYGFVIGHGGAGLIPFTTADYQKELLTTIRKNKYSIAAKSRQLGCSTVVMFFALWFSIFSVGKRTLVAANTKETAKEFIAKLKVAYEYLPEWMKPSALQYSVETIEFDTKSRIKAVSSSKDASRSYNATLFILDEAAFIEDANEVTTAIMPIVAASDAKIIAISTPNGDSDANWFYQTFSMAKSNLNGWSWHEFPWQVSPYFNQIPNFKQEQIRKYNGDKQKFAREFEVSFSAGSNSLFCRSALDSFVSDTNILNKCYGGMTYEDTYWFWKAARPGRQYTIGVDCSANKPTSRDFSSFVVLDNETQEQMAEYNGKLPTEVMADILFKTARHYNNAQLVIEENNYSEMLFMLLEAKGYTNFWYAQGKTRPGFNTNRHSRILLVERLLLFFNHDGGMACLKSSRLKAQCENFVAGMVYADGSRKFEAGKGVNDDIVIATALALMPLTPREEVSSISEDRMGIAIDAKDILSSSEYPDEYIEFYANKMGISETSLRSKLTLYHDIKRGRYSGTGVDDLDIKHPVHEWERLNSISEFLGENMAQIATEVSANEDRSIRLIGDRRQQNRFGITDIFSDEFSSFMDAHNAFFGPNRIRGRKF